MKNLNLLPGDPITLTLSSDVRIGPVQYANDIVWQINPGGGSPPALSIETTAGLQVRSLRIFPRFRRDESFLNDPLEFSNPVSVRQIYPNYIALTCAPFNGLDLTFEYWVSASNNLAGRITAYNSSILRENLSIELCALLSPLTEGSNFQTNTYGASPILSAEFGKQTAILYLTGSPAPSTGPFPALRLDLDLYPARQQQFTWALSILPNLEDAVQLARLTTARLWHAEISHIEMVNVSQQLQIETGNRDWDTALALTQVTARRLLMPESSHLPKPSFVLARQPEHGFSLRGDGSDYHHLWNGQTALDTWYLTSLLLPSAPHLARGLLENFIHVMEESGFIDWKPGLAGQRSRYLAQPFLAITAWQIHQTAPQPNWLEKIYPSLLRFLHHWFEDHDHDQNGYPEWDHALQTGLEQAPIYDRWSPTGQGVEIWALECPSLGAMLFQECRCLSEIARLLKREQDLPWLTARMSTLRQDIEQTWDEAAITYRYQDTDTHCSPAGEELLQFQGSASFRIRRKFSPARRLQILLYSQSSATQMSLIRIHGNTPHGKVIEELGPRQFHWLQGLGRATSRNVFTTIERLEILQFHSEDTGILRTIDYTQEDISLLLPLWATIPDPPRAEKIIRHTLLERYHTACGFATLPSPAQAGVMPIWNALLGEGLLAYGLRAQAAELCTTLLTAALPALRQTSAFRSPLCTQQMPVTSTEANALNTLPPLGLFLKTLGLQQISANSVILQNFSPFLRPITVQYQGTKVTFRPNVSEVAFPGAELITISTPGLHKITR